MPKCRKEVITWHVKRRLTSCDPGLPESAAESSGLIMKNGNKTYVIGLHFSETSKDTLEDKVKKLIKKDVESDKFLSRSPYIIEAHQILS